MAYNVQTNAQIRTQKGVVFRRFLIKTLWVLECCMCYTFRRCLAVDVQCMGLSQAHYFRLYLCQISLKSAEPFPLCLWRSYHHDSVGGLFRTINLTRTHSVSTWRQRRFENRHQIFYFCTYRPEILHTSRQRQYAKSGSPDFWISSPKKLTPLWILRLHYGQWDEKIQIDISRSFANISGWYFQTH